MRREYCWTANKICVQLTFSRYISQETGSDTDALKSLFSNYNNEEYHSTTAVFYCVYHLHSVHVCYLRFIIVLIFCSAENPHGYLTFQSLSVPECNRSQRWLFQTSLHFSAALPCNTKITHKY